MSIADPYTDPNQSPACTLEWPGDTCYCTGREGCRSDLFAPDEDDEDEGEDL